MKQLISVTLVEENGEKKLNLSIGDDGVTAVDELISALGKFRAQASPPIALTEPKAGEPVEIQPWLRWQSGVVFEGTHLGFLHPGFGWLHFLLTPEILDCLRQMQPHDEILRDDRPVQ